MHITLSFRLAILLILLSVVVSAQSVKETYADLIDRYEYDSARLLVDQLLEQDPNNPKWHSMLGDVLLYQFKYDSSLDVLKTALSLAHDTANTFKGEQYLLMAYTYHDRGDFSTSLSLTRQAKDLVPESSSLLYRDILSHMALEHNKMGRRDSGMYYLKKLVEKEIILNDSAYIARTMNAIGQALIKMKEYDKGLHYYDQSEKFLTKRNDLTRGVLYNNRASALFELGKMDSVEQYYKKSINIYAAHKDSVSVGKRLINLGRYYAHINMPNRADSAFNMAELIFQNKGAVNLQNHLIISRSNVYVQNGQTKKAIKVLDEIVESSMETQNFNFAVEALNKLLDIYKSSGQYKDALETIEMLTEINDKSSRASTLYKTKEMELSNSIEQRKRELKLQAENHELQLKNERRLYLFFGVIGLLIILATIIVSRLTIQKNKINQQLLTEEIDNLRHRISRIISDVTLDAIEVDMNKLSKVTLNELTDREIEILQLAITNKSNADIADEVHLSVNTVKYHLKNIYNKLGVSSKLEAREALAQVDKERQG